MPDHSGLRGTDVGQDTRFKDKEAASIKATKFPANFSEKVDLRKVNISVLKPWIAKKVIELIRVEDDIVVEFVFSMLEDREKPMADPKKMQVSLLGFMDKYGAAAFMEELWTLLLSAQASTGGIPASFLEAKKAEIQNRQSDVMRFGASIPIPPGRSSAADMFDEKPRMNQQPYGQPGRGGYGREDHRAGDRGRDGGYGQRGPPGRNDDRRGDRGYERERDNGYGNRGPRRSPSPRRDRDDRDRYGGRDRDERDTRRRPTPPRRPSPPPRRRSPSPRRRSPSPPPRRRERERERSDTPPLRKRRDSIKQEEGRKEKRADRKRDDTPPLRRARSRSRSGSPPPKRKHRGRSPSRTPTRSDTRGRSRSPTVTPPRRGARRDDSTPPRKRRSPSDSRSPSPPPATRRRYDSTPPAVQRGGRRKDDDGKRADEGIEDKVRRKGRGSFAVENEDKPQKPKKEEEKPKKKLEGALGKSRWAD